MKKKTGKKKWELPIIGVIRDIKNYISWIRTIRGESSDPNSKFNKFGLDYNIFYIIYMVFSLPEEDRVLPDNIKRLRILESLTPVHQYLDIDLGFADYIIPEFNQFYDKDGNPTLDYGIVYRFSFKKLSFKWVLKRVIIWGAIIGVLSFWDILEIIRYLVFFN